VSGGGAGRVSVTVLGRRSVSCDVHLLRTRFSLRMAPALQTSREACGGYRGRREVKRLREVDRWLRRPTNLKERPERHESYGIAG